jgi:hypothetical protein
MTKRFNPLVHLDQGAGVSAVIWARHAHHCKQIDLLLTHMTGGEIEALLNGYHIKVFAHQMVESGTDDDPDHLSILVNKKQGRWAEYILRSEGLIITSAPIDKRNKQWAALRSTKMRKRWDKSPSRLLSPTNRFFSALFAPGDPRPEEWR